MVFSSKCVKKKDCVVANFKFQKNFDFSRVWIILILFGVNVLIFTEVIFTISLFHCCVPLAWGYFREFSLNYFNLLVLGFKWFKDWVKVYRQNHNFICRKCSRKYFCIPQQSICLAFNIFMFLLHTKMKQFLKNKKHAWWFCFWLMLWWFRIRS